jgi:hypothetical protein
LELRTTFIVAPDLNQILFEYCGSIAATPDKSKPFKWKFFQSPFSILKNPVGRMILLELQAVLWYHTGKFPKKGVQRVKAIYLEKGSLLSFQPYRNFGVAQ